jgi:hypothetical protein
MTTAATNPRRLYTVAEQAAHPTAIPSRTLAGWEALADGFLSSDLKCSPVAGTSKDGTPRASDSVRVATWLPSGPPEQGGTCPGASTYCHRAPGGTLTCYALRLERGRPSLAALVDKRLTTWESLDQGEKVTLAAAILKRAHHTQTQPGPLSAHADNPVARPAVRLGAGGDLHDEATGQAWADALAWASLPASGIDDLSVWLYSRSYCLDVLDDPLGPIADGIAAGTITNTSAYLSTDPSMIERTRTALAGRYSHLPVAALASTMTEGRDILDTLRGPDRHREIICPTDRPTKPLPIASRRTGEPHARGICTRCRACIDPARGLDRSQDVIFVRR